MDYSRFQKIYANLPDATRSGIVAVIDEKPYSWNAAFFEMKNGTELGEKIYKKLIKMGII